jgi:type II secretory pathway component PulM
MKEFFLQNSLLRKWEMMPSVHKKRFFIWLGIAIVLFLILSLVTVSNKIDTLKDKIIQQQKLLVWMVQAGADINKLRHTSVPSNATKQTSLLTVVEQESKINTWNKYHMEMKQGENDQVEISFARINFDDFIQGLEQLWEKDRIQIGKTSVQRIEATNTVQVTLSLQAS